jgi:predicted DNA-binding transcriptional regulator AlpA
MPESLWITPTELGALLGVNRRTVFRYIECGQIPKPKHFSARNVRWRREDLGDVLQNGPAPAGTYSNSAPTKTAARRGSEKVTSKRKRK